MARLCYVKNRLLTPQPFGQLPFKKASEAVIIFFDALKPLCLKGFRAIYVF